MKRSKWVGRAVTRWDSVSDRLCSPSSSPALRGTCHLAVNSRTFCPTRLWHKPLLSSVPCQTWTLQQIIQRTPSRIYPLVICCLTLVSQYAGSPLPLRRKILLRQVYRTTTLVRNGLLFFQSQRTHHKVSICRYQFGTQCDEASLDRVPSGSRT